MRVIAKIFGRPLGVLSDEFNERIYFQYFPEYLASGRKISPFALSFDGIAQYENLGFSKGYLAYLRTLCLTHGGIFS